MIHLDTGHLIRALVRGSPEDAAMRAWLQSGERLAMSTVAWAELLCGPLDRRSRSLAATLVSERVALTETHARMAADLFNDSGRRRGSLADCMIAAVAMEADAPLATTNAEDFERFARHGLRLV